MERRCHRCGRDVEGTERIGRRDVCLGCGSDLHCCLNCDFHDPSFHNHCRETQAERQVDRERGNFCDFFRFRVGRPARTDESSEARARLDALFGRKGQGS